MRTFLQSYYSTSFLVILFKKKKKGKFKNATITEMLKVMGHI